jgi:hypothetical protein
MYYFPIQMANTYSQVYIHLVFAVKGRQSLIFFKPIICRSSRALACLFSVAINIGHRWCQKYKLLLLSILPSPQKFLETRFSTKTSSLWLLWIYDEIFSMSFLSTCAPGRKNPTGA